MQLIYLALPLRKMPVLPLRKTPAIQPQKEVFVSDTAVPTSSLMVMVSSHLPILLEHEQ
jgi:hypothetical protein